MVRSDSGLSTTGPGATGKHWPRGRLGQRVKPCSGLLRASKQAWDTSSDWVYGAWNGPPQQPVLARALEHLRPYRGGGPVDEHIKLLFERIRKEVARQIEALEDLEEIEDEEILAAKPKPTLADVIDQGVRLLASGRSAGQMGDAWVSCQGGRHGKGCVVRAASGDGLSRRSLSRAHVRRKARRIVGNQSDEERLEQLSRFRRPDGPQFLVSSRAGGEGLNLQVAASAHSPRRFPWNRWSWSSALGAFIDLVRARRFWSIR